MERIELADHPHRRLRSWESGEPGHWRHVLIEIGTLDAGGWYAAQTSKRGTKAWLAHSERQVCVAVEKWRARLGQDWRETTGQDA